MNQKLFVYGSNLIETIKTGFVKDLKAIEARVRKWEKTWERLNPLPEDHSEFGGIEKEIIMWEVSTEIDEAYKAREIANEKISAIGQVLALQTMLDMPIMVDL